MIKMIYDYDGRHVEEECETPLAASVSMEDLKENSHISNLKIDWDCE